MTTLQVLLKLGSVWELSDRCITPLTAMTIAKSLMQVYALSAAGKANEKVHTR